MKKILLLLFCGLVATSAVRAQDYNWGVGLRPGIVATGITVKGFIGGANALEGILSFVDGVNFYGLYERNVPLNGKGLNFYYGAGGNIGNWEKKKKDKFTVGIDGVMGIEYKVDGVPIVFGIDYKPAINLIGHDGFIWDDFGLHVRVVF